jgi:hypothetical protein
VLSEYCCRKLKAIRDHDLSLEIQNGSTELIANRVKENDNRNEALHFAVSLHCTGHVGQGTNRLRYADLQTEFIEEHFVRVTAVDRTCAFSKLKTPLRA